jgi:hypothetical protein
MSIVTYNNRSIRNISAIPGAVKSLTHIKTLTASGQATFNFVNGSSDVVLDSTYPIYVFKLINIHPSANSRIELRGSTDTGSNYTATITSTCFRAYHDEADSDTSYAYDTGSDAAQANFVDLINASTGTDNDQSGVATMYLFNPSSTTFVKHFIFETQGYAANDYTINSYGAGYFNTTSAIDAIQFKSENGNSDSGTFKMYGLKDS